MSDSADVLVDEFISRWEAGEDVDLAEYVARADRSQRQQVQDRIDRYFAEAATPDFDAAAFEAFRSDPHHQALVDRALEAAPVSLLALRQAAKVRREAIAEELAAALEVPGHEQRVRRHYHDLEVGNVSPLRVNDRVWQTLSRLFGEGVDRLRDAAMTAFDTGTAGQGAAAFARSGTAGVRDVDFLLLDAADAEPEDDPADAAFFDDPE